MFTTESYIDSPCQHILDHCSKYFFKKLFFPRHFREKKLVTLWCIGVVVFNLVAVEIEMRLVDQLVGFLTGIPVHYSVQFLACPRPPPLQAPLTFCIQSGL